MKATILCRKEEKTEIVSAIAGEAFELRVCFISDSMNIAQAQKGEIYLLSWKGRDRIRPYYAKLKEASVWFWIHGAVFHGSEELKKHLEKAVKAQNWRLAKNINDVLREYDLVEQNLYLHCYPSELQLESTNVCNAKCIMCSHSYENNKNAGFIDGAFLEEIQEILPYLRLICLHGNGEPFLNPKLPELIRKMAAYDVRFTTNTNLSVLNENILECIKLYFTGIRISCDGATKETFESIRRNLSFDRFCDNCGRLRKSSIGLEMTMASVVMKQNVEELPHLVELAAALGFQKIVFSQLCPDVRIGNQQDSLQYYPNVADYYYRKARERGRELGIETVLPGSVGHHRWNEADFAEEKRRIHEKDMAVGRIYAQKSAPYAEEKRICGICDWVIERPYINLKKDVNLCCISQMKALGNLRKQKFMEIWNGEEYQKIRSAFYNGILPNECRGCEFLLQNALTHLKSTEEYMSRFEYKTER